MQFMVQIVVSLPGDWSDEKLVEMTKAENARGHELMREGEVLRIFRIVGRRANFGIWQAETLEKLHQNLLSLPMHPWMEITVTPIIEHPSTAAYRETYGELPAI